MPAARRHAKTTASAGAATVDARQHPAAKDSARWVPWLLVGAVLLTFGRIVTHEFARVDDPVTLWRNPHFNPPTFTTDKVLWFWDPRNIYMSLYVPVTYTVWGLVARATWVPTPDETGSHLDPAVFHAASLLIHLSSVLLVYAILRLVSRRGAWPAAIGALLFGLHPLQVEAVAWTSGMKDLLCGAFSLAALYLYLRAATVTEDGITLPAWRYALATICLALGLLSKPTAMVTPLLAIVLDYCFLKHRTIHILRRLAPWFVMSAAAAAWARHAQPAFGTDALPLWQRPVLAGGSLAFYLGKLLLPINLVFDHAWRPSVVVRQPWFCASALVPVALGVWVARRRVRYPWLVAAALLFVIPLLPVLGFTRFSFQFFSTVAEHYAYLAMLGPALAIACWVGQLSPPRRATVTRAAAVVLTVLAAVSFVELAHWRTAGTQFDRQLAIAPASPMGHNGWGKWYLDRHEPAKAEEEFLAAIQVRPDFTIAHENLLQTYAARGKVEQAIRQWDVLREVNAQLPAELRQDYSNTMLDYGRAEESIGAYANAKRYFEEQLRLTPSNAAASQALASVRAKLAAATRPATGPTTKATTAP